MNDRFMCQDWWKFKIENFSVCLPSFSIILSSKHIKIMYTSRWWVLWKTLQFSFQVYINLTKNYDTFSRSLKHKKIQTIVLTTSSVLTIWSCSTSPAVSLWPVTSRLGTLAPGATAGRGEECGCWPQAALPHLTLDLRLITRWGTALDTIST